MSQFVSVEPPSLLRSLTDELTFDDGGGDDEKDNGDDNEDDDDDYDGEGEYH